MFTLDIANDLLQLAANIAVCIWLCMLYWLLTG